MVTYSIIPLSGSTNFLPISVAATGSPRTLIHTSDSTAGTVDRLYVEVVNNDSGTDYTLTLEYGSDATANAVLITIEGGYAGPIPVANTHCLQGGVTLKASANVGNKLFVHGHVVRRAL